jgi:hypothetical protein
MLLHEESDLDCMYSYLHEESDLDCNAKDRATRTPLKLDIGNNLITTDLQSYHDTSYSRGGVNQVWILTYSKDM